MVNELLHAPKALTIWKSALGCMKPPGWCDCIISSFQSGNLQGFWPLWAHHITHPIFKSGNNSDLNNYRTITIEHTFAKLYATVLHIWFSKHFERNKNRAIGKVSFRGSYQTVDHTFTLWAIIEEARQQYSKALCFFVDFQKAFNSGLRTLLFQRPRNMVFMSPPLCLPWGSMTQLLGNFLHSRAFWLYQGHQCVQNSNRVAHNHLHIEIYSSELERYLKENTHVDHSWTLQF